MATKVSRFYNGKDGTYANVPMRLVNTNVFRGRQQYGSDVLIANWYEDRSKVNARQRKPRTKPLAFGSVAVVAVAFSLQRRFLVSTPSFILRSTI